MVKFILFVKGLNLPRVHLGALEGAKIFFPKISWGYTIWKDQCKKLKPWWFPLAVVRKDCCGALSFFFWKKKIDVFNCQTGIKEPKLEKLKRNFLGGKRGFGSIIGEYLGCFGGDGCLDGSFFFLNIPNKNMSLGRSSPDFQWGQGRVTGGDGGWGWDVYFRRVF